MSPRCRFLLIAAFAVAAALVAATPDAAMAAPDRLIILRHGEKKDDYRLCQAGVRRSHALAAHYLGRGAPDSLFVDGKPPVAFFGITLHTIELMAPTVATWGMPLITYAVFPPISTEHFDLDLNVRTRQAYHAIVDDPRFEGRTVVLTWEHHHIASKVTEQAFPGEKVTLRQLLDLGRFPDVPETWPGSNYDYFWIVDFDAKTRQPKSFRAVKQVFPAPFTDVPMNDWGKPLPPAPGCQD